MHIAQAPRQVDRNFQTLPQCEWCGISTHWLHMSPSFTQDHTHFYPVYDYGIWKVEKTLPDHCRHKHLTSLRSIEAAALLSANSLLSSLTVFSTFARSCLSFFLSSVIDVIACRRCDSSFRKSGVCEAWRTSTIKQVLTLSSQRILPCNKYKIYRYACKSCYFSVLRQEASEDIYILSSCIQKQASCTAHMWANGLLDMQFMLIH